MAQQETKRLLTHGEVPKNTDKFITAVDDNRTADKNYTQNVLLGCKTNKN